jgi:hypothetical protein
MAQSTKASGCALNCQRTKAGVAEAEAVAVAVACVVATRGAVIGTVAVACVVATRGAVIGIAGATTGAASVAAGVS